MQGDDRGVFRPIVRFYRVISIRVLVCIHDHPD